MLTPAALTEALASHARVDMPALPGRTNHLKSGVLLPLVWPRPGEPQVIATVRAAHLRRHAGEVCFPGGRPDPGDADLEATALREAREELGIDGAEVLGELSSVPLYTSEYRLFPFVARVGDAPFVINHDEVATVLRLSLGAVLAQETIEAIPWRHQGQSGLSPIFRAGEHVIFGATAYALHELLVVSAPLFGRRVPTLAAGDLSWSDVLPAAVAPG